MTSTLIHRQHALLLIFCSLLGFGIHPTVAWTTQLHYLQRIRLGPWIAPTTRSISSTTTRLWAALPEGYQEFGEFVIRKAGAECGVQTDDDLTIEWKPGKIIVTVRADAYASADDNTEEKDNDADDDEEEKDESEEQPPARGIDVTKLAKAINYGLDDVDGVGYAIAEAHEIEVTTPGASDELTGNIMFQAYKGFDVICQFMDRKTKKIKTIEGRLAERNNEFTIVNIKGRMKKMKNDTVLSVKLPKAKKEKGGKK